MPKGPKGEKRPADVVGMSVLIAKIATGEVEETAPSGRRASGLAGAKARAAALSAVERKQIAAVLVGPVITKVDHHSCVGVATAKRIRRAVTRLGPAVAGVEVPVIGVHIERLKRVGIGIEIERTFEMGAGN